MLNILYILLIFVFLIIIKQFYFNTSEKFHVGDEQEADDHNEDGNDQSVDGGSSNRNANTNENTNTNANANLGSGGGPARQTTEDTTSASTAETTRASEQTNETTNAVESSSPSDTTQASIETQSFNEQDQSSEEARGTEEAGNSDDGTITEEQLLRELIQRIQDERDNSTQPVITARADSSCCGLNIYNDELMNINKCLEQHLKKERQIGQEYITDDWKSTQDRSCKNPPNILAKTTNCSGNNSVIGKFYPHIKTLHDIVISTKAEGCPYRASLFNRPSDEEKKHLNLDSSNPLTDFQRMRQFQRNIDCRLAGLGNTLQRSSTRLRSTKQPMRQCSGPD